MQEADCLGETVWGGEAHYAEGEVEGADWAVGGGGDEELRLRCMLVVLMSMFLLVLRLESWDRGFECCEGGFELGEGGGVDEGEAEEVGEWGTFFLSLIGMWSWVGHVFVVVVVVMIKSREGEGEDELQMEVMSGLELL